jgi:hypothetical protein
MCRVRRVSIVRSPAGAECSCVPRLNAEKVCAVEQTPDSAQGHIEAADYGRLETARKVAEAVNVAVAQLSER